MNMMTYKKNCTRLNEYVEPLIEPQMVKLQVAQN